MEPEPQSREEIVRVGRLIYDKGWVAASDGNISIRMPDGRVMATPTGVSKGLMRAEDMILCDPDGGNVVGPMKSTTEIEMHLTVYSMRPDVSGVVHAHPPVATGFAASGRSLNLDVLPEAIASLGCVPLVEYATPGTPALSASLRPYIPQHNAILMANHGVIAYGANVLRALSHLEAVEHAALITLVAELLGGPRLLPQREIQNLFEARGRCNTEAKSNFEPGCLAAAEDGG